MPFGRLLQTMGNSYNHMEKPKKKDQADIVSQYYRLNFDCKVKGFLDASYGKYGTNGAVEQVLMEYGQMFPYLSDYLPRDLAKNKKFINWLNEDDRIYEFA